MHILFLAANGEDQVPLFLKQEIYDIQRRVSRASRPAKVRFSVYPKLNLSDLQTILEDTEPDVLHIAAHADLGQFELAATNHGSGHDEMIKLSADVLADYLAALRLRFRLVVLNGARQQR